MKRIYWVESGNCQYGELKFFDNDRDAAVKFAEMMWDHYTDFDKEIGCCASVHTAEVPAELDSFDDMLDYVYNEIGGYDVEESFVP